jgi:hypothetical protein
VVASRPALHNAVSLRQFAPFRSVRRRAHMYVQYGCGPFSAPQGWENFDSSLTLRWERIPIVEKFGFPDRVDINGLFAV